MKRLLVVMNLESQKVIASRLVEGEEIIWVGPPRQGFIFKKSYVIQSSYRYIFGIFLFIGGLGILIGKQSPVGLIYLIVGLHMLVGRFVVDAIRRSKTHYGLTNLRIIVSSGMKNQNTKTFPLDSLREISVSESKDGHGTILFDEKDGRSSLFRKRKASVDSPILEDIENVQIVYDKILSAQMKR